MLSAVKFTASPECWIFIFFLKKKPNYWSKKGLRQCYNFIWNLQQTSHLFLFIIFGDYKTVQETVSKITGIKRSDIRLLTSKLFYATGGCAICFANIRTKVHEEISLIPFSNFVSTRNNTWPNLLEKGESSLPYVHSIFTTTKLHPNWKRRTEEKIPVLCFH